MRLKVPPEKLRTIETTNLKDISKPEPDKETAPAAPAPASLDLSIEEARATGLKHNLDIEAGLLDPTISKQGITEEEARFEALLFANVDWAKLDQPPGGTSRLIVDPTDPSKIIVVPAVGRRSESITVEPGVSLPLTTGGTLTASAPMSRTRISDDVGTNFNPSYENDLNFSIAQPLLRGAGPRANTHAIRVARYNTQITEARTKLQIMSVIADIDRLYWRLYAARREVEVRKQQYDLAQRQLERAQHQVKAGKVAEIEVTRAESGAADRLEGIIVAENTLRQRQRELKKALNKPDLPVESPTTIVPTTPPNPVHYNLDGPDLARAALGKRMEMLEKEIQLAIDASAIDYQKNQALPLFNLDYTYGVNGLGGTYSRAWKVAGTHDFVDHTISARAEIPLGNEAAKSRVRRAIYTRLKDVSTKAGQELTIRREVLDAVDSIETDWQRILAARRRTVLATRTFEAEQRQFEQGLRTSTDVLVAQADLSDAQLAEVSAISDYEIAQVDLAVATGTLLGASHIHWQPANPPLKGSIPPRKD